MKVAASLFMLWFLVSCGDDSSESDLRYRDEIFADVEITSDITYGSAVTFEGQNLVLTLDIYQPQGDLATKRATIVWIHGGGFVGGDKTDVPFIELAERYARRGYLTVSINYRTVDNAFFNASQANKYTAMMDAMYDAKASVRWLRAHSAEYRVDTDLIAIGGGSAGAFTALHVSYVDGEGTSGNPGYSSGVKAVVDIWGGMYDVTAMQPGDAPLIIIHGTNDSVVSFTYAENLVDRAEFTGVFYEFHPLDGVGHAAWDHIDEIIAWVTPFLYSNVITP